MSNPQYTDALLFVYDVRPILKALEPPLIEWMHYQSFLSYLPERELVDLWFQVTIYDFQHVGVAGYAKNNVPCEIINAFRFGAEDAKRLLYRELYLPPEIAGSNALIKREGHTLYIVAYDMNRLRDVDRNNPPHFSRL